ncbi:hypothetical protein GTY44_42110 [Streptomyces sp. SID5914]|nr:lipocalin-like domain-containing protein [Streptomyces sp. SID5914]MZG20002.1 hypothetical protein [Streptomyces sp. SID5914]
MDDLVDAWNLRDFTATRGDHTTQPLGDKPSGMLLYTAHGWMSALLTASPDTATGTSSAEADDGGKPRKTVKTVAYAGRWERTADGLVLHHVRYSHYAPWTGTTLQRAVRQNADELELTATGAGGYRLGMLWQRARA